MHLTARIACCLALALTLSGCSKFSMPEMPEMPSFKFGIPKLPGIHKFDIQQGNVITQEMIDQLKPGMTKSQVRFVMGTPLVADTFSQNRWDYYYSKQPAEGEEVRERVAIFFANDLLVGLKGDFAPGRGNAPGSSSTPTPEDAVPETNPSEANSSETKPSETDVPEISTPEINVPAITPGISPDNSTDTDNTNVGESA